jgi:hypothetical protein
LFKQHLLVALVVSQFWVEGYKCRVN